MYIANIEEVVEGPDGCCCTCTCTCCCSNPISRDFNGAADSMVPGASIWAVKRG